MREPAGWGVLLAAAMQANDAMCLFEEHGLLHRDLAARNVLVFSFHPRDRSKVLVKLCDYGLVTDNNSDFTRHERAVDEEGPEDMPWRYIPPEVMASRAWSHKSDIWSFGDPPRALFVKDKKRPTQQQPEKALSCACTYVRFLSTLLQHCQ